MIAVMIGIAATAAWLVFALMEPSKVAHLTSGEICFARVRTSAQLLPQVCVTGEARAPHGSDTIVLILSRSNLLRFIDLLDSQARAGRFGREAAGTFEVRDSIRRLDAPEWLAWQEVATVLGEAALMAQPGPEIALARDFVRKLSAAP